MNDEDIKFVIIARGMLIHEAHMLVNVLEASGIPAIVRDEHIAREFVLNSATGGAKVEVLERDAEEAKLIMKQYEEGTLFPDSPADVEENEKTSEAVTPKRKSSWLPFWITLAVVIALWIFKPLRYL